MKTVGLTIEGARSFRLGSDTDSENFTSGSDLSEEEKSSFSSSKVDAYVVCIKQNNPDDTRMEETDKKSKISFPI